MEDPKMYGKQLICVRLKDDAHIQDFAEIVKAFFQSVTDFLIDEMNEIGFWVDEEAEETVTEKLQQLSLVSEVF